VSVVAPVYDYAMQCMFGIRNSSYKSEEHNASKLKMDNMTKMLEEEYEKMLLCRGVVSLYPPLIT